MPLLVQGVQNQEVICGFPGKRSAQEAGFYVCGTPGFTGNQMAQDSDISLCLRLTVYKIRMTITHALLSRCENQRENGLKVF